MFYFKILLSRNPTEIKCFILNNSKGHEINSDWADLGHMSTPEIVALAH